MDKKIKCSIVGNITQKLELLSHYDNNLKLLICENEEEGIKLLNDAKPFFSCAYYYPEKDIFYYNAESSSTVFMQERLNALEAIAHVENVLIITSWRAAIELMPSMEVITAKEILLKVGNTLDMDSLRVELVKNGYEILKRVENKGELAIRGSIIDIFGFTMDNPVRIELYDDEIDSIREFDVYNQRSLDAIDSVRIFIASDNLEEKSSSLLKIFGEREGLVALDEPIKLLSNFDDVGEEELLLSSEIYRMLEGIDLVSYSIYNDVQLEENFIVDIVHTTSIDSFAGDIEKMIASVSMWEKDNYQIALYTASMARAKRMLKIMVDQGLVASIQPQNVKKGVISILLGSISNSFIYEDDKRVFISDTDIYKKDKKKRAPKFKVDNSETIKSFSQLEIDDVVVHERYGIGIYKGIENIQMNGVGRDCIKILYSGNSYLHILATNVSTIQKYLGERKSVQISDLNSKAWAKKITKAKKQAEVVAKELVDLYAKRLEHKGYIFSHDSDLQKEMEELFEFVETEDQLNAIDDIKNDMQSDKIMDRLLCGDVGFGKTEVAMRAAFKAVVDSKQVAVLVPTTILANQHYKVFSERLKDFPVNIAMLSRFVTVKGQSEVEKGLNNGNIDIVIGTHALLRKSITYKDLGLLIIDEEQRFGVKHKEKLKELKSTVDVLTLTATPIPRTLHMSLSGIRDLSLLKEAPYDRQPIQTYILEFREDLVKVAIKKELDRGGQVYFLHNRIDSIYEIADKIGSLLPEANIGVVHGRLPIREIERTFNEFNEHEIDILVSTTIVETGLDIPNVNTILINNADHFGLSTLYQLRGRVGRSSKKAYAYLLHQANKNLSGVQSERLRTIREFTQLGAGSKIALKDLELRGPGAMLGSMQSGHIEAIGYDLYCKILRQAILQEKGESENSEANIDIDIEMGISDEYIPYEADKLEMYKKFNLIQGEEDYHTIIDECIDRFGEPPKSVMNIVELGLIKGIASRLGIANIKEVVGYINIYFDNMRNINKDKLLEFIMNNSKRVSVNTGVNSFIKIDIRKTNDKLQLLKNIIFGIYKL